MNLNLTNITLLSYNCVNPIQSVKALIYSSRLINFGEIILVSNHRPEKLPSNIKFHHYDGKTHHDSSMFSYKLLPDLVNTEYVLCVHDDGFVINPHLWDYKFLNYDYIGAPWKNYNQINRVGNGGFSLRSKKFLNLCKNINSLGRHEDGELTNDYYYYFVKNGCKYAPLEVAMKFSLESKIPECEYNLDNTFGFHGRGDPTTVSVHDGEYHQFQEKCKLLETVEL